MKVYKLNKEELLTLKRYDTAFRSASIQSKAVQDVMIQWVVANILPKMGVKRVPGMALPIDVNLEEGIVKVSIERPDNKIIVPRGAVRKPRDGKIN